MTTQEPHQRPAKLFPELEEVRGPEAMRRVDAWNAESLGRLEAHADFEDLKQRALAIHEARDKIPYPGMIPTGHSSSALDEDVPIENFWRDEKSVKGVLRRTTLKKYLASNGGQAESVVDWEIVLDVDALAAAEKANIVWKGHSALMAGFGNKRDRTLVKLSDGGKDAVVSREFDLERKVFVTKETHGREPFYLPEAKSRTSWEDADTLLVGTDWGGDEGMTDSGYPRVVKRLRRGQALSEATLVHAGSQKDVSNSAWVFKGSDSKGEPIRDTMIGRAITFYEEESFLLLADGSKRLLPLPKKVQMYSIFRDQLVFSIKQDWQGFKEGSVLSFSWSAWKASADPAVIPTIAVLHDAAKSKATIEGVSESRCALLVSILQDVVPGVRIFRWDGSAWAGGEDVAFPDVSGGGDSGSSVSVADTVDDSDLVFVTREGFLVSESIYSFRLNDEGRQAAPAQTVRSVPARFDASSLVAEQKFTKSKDGTTIPYFVVHKKDLVMDGSTPTILYGYGGFEISLPPDYNGVLGAQWLERGYAFVLANIRGGGEYGPAWHDAGLKTKRQCVYDDFIAVAEDVIATKLTSAKHLACMGGSNGGLLVGVMYTQRPDLFGAVVCQVPLLDMLEYHTLLAGASWMDEYGDPDDPVEGAFLQKLSPLHNIDAAKTYPPILFVTSTADDRVHPGHARKMAARLEELGKPFLLFENTDGGHAAGADLKAISRRQALEKVFLLQTIV